MRCIPRMPDQLAIVNVENMHLCPRSRGHHLLNNRGSGHSEPGSGLRPLSSYLSAIKHPLVLSLVRACPIKLCCVSCMRWIHHGTRAHADLHSSYSTFPNSLVDTMITDRQSLTHSARRSPSRRFCSHSACHDACQSHHECPCAVQLKAL